MKLYEREIGHVQKYSVPLRGNIYENLNFKKDHVK